MSSAQAMGRARWVVITLDTLCGGEHRGPDVLVGNGRVEHGGFGFGVAEQLLDCPKIAGASVGDGAAPVAQGVCRQVAGQMPRDELAEVGLGEVATVRGREQPWAVELAGALADGARQVVLEGDEPTDQDIRILGAKRTIDPDEEEALIASVTSVSEVLHVIA